MREDNLSIGYWPNSDAREKTQQGQGISSEKEQQKGNKRKWESLGKGESKRVGNEVRWNQGQVVNTKQETTG